MGSRPITFLWLWPATVVCAGLNESAVVRRVFLPAARRRQQNGGGGDRRRQRNRKYKIFNQVQGDSVLEAAIWFFECNFPPHSIIFIANAEFVIVNEVML